MWPVKSWHLLNLGSCNTIWACSYLFQLVLSNCHIFLFPQNCQKMGVIPCLFYTRARTPELHVCSYDGKYTGGMEQDWTWFIIGQWSHRKFNFSQWGRCSVMLTRHLVNACWVEAANIPLWKWCDHGLCSVHISGCIPKCFVGFLQDEAKIQTFAKGDYVYATGAQLGSMIKMKGEAKVIFCSNHVWCVKVGSLYRKLHNIFENFKVWLTRLL
jgi:hypothetical protein